MNKTKITPYPLAAVLTLALTTAATLVHDTYAITTPPNTLPNSVTDPAQSTHPLIVAIELGDATKVKTLLEKSPELANLRAQDAVGSPALLIALGKGQPEIVSLLLKSGSDPNAKDSRGTPILLSVSALVTNLDTSNATLKAIETLIKEGKPSVNDKDTAYIGDDRTALHQAASNGAIKLVKILLENGADPNLTNRVGETPLFAAAEKGRTDVVAELLARGVQVNIRSKFTQMTPLMMAAENGHSEVVKLLLEKKAELSGKNAFEKTTLEIVQDALAQLKPQAEQQKRYQATIELIQKSMKSGTATAQTADNSDTEKSSIQHSKDAKPHAPESSDSVDHTKLR